MIQQEEIKERKKRKGNKKKEKRKIELYKQYKDELELLHYVTKLQNYNPVIHSPCLVY